jgi:hypothetical protein
MAVNKPVGDSARKGAVRERSQLKTKLQGEETWTKRSKAPANKPFKGVRKEKQR